ncbi:MAG TPA: Pr6Pr family membrane protein, partial [Ferruginibacter sp.]|nr:Pr6Pr family membrane protein [Ferruginibacter sp.]
WVLFVPKSSLQYKHAFGWLIYPAVYLCWILIYGALSGYYPYPFVNVVDLGYDRVLINCAGLFLAFLGLSLFLILLGKFLSRTKN